MKKIEIAQKLINQDNLSDFCDGFILDGMMTRTKKDLMEILKQTMEDK